MARVHGRSYVRTSVRSSPEYTTNGALPKCWRRIGGEIVLFKGGSEGAANTGREPQSEFHAAQVAATRRPVLYPDFDEAAAARLGLDKSRCLYVGDSEVDVLTARNASIDCASVSWGFRSAGQLREAGASVIFDSPEILRDWILAS